MGCSTSKFVDHHVIQNHLSQNKPFTSLDVSRCNQVDDEELSVGLLTQELIDHLLNEYDVTPRELQCFYKGVRAFFSKAFQYCCMWLRLDDDLLKYCVFVDVRKRADTPFSYVEKTLPYFSHIHQTVKDNPALLEDVHDEYVEFQAMPDSDIPEAVWKSAAIGSSDSEFDKKRKRDLRMDVIWGHLRGRFPNLSDIALTVLTVPHSNASEERVFSIIKKNKTEFRSRLELGGSLNSIMRIKMALPESLMPCHKWKPSNELLLKCKRATREYNQQHSSASTEQV